MRVIKFFISSKCVKIHPFYFVFKKHISDVWSTVRAPSCDPF